MLEPVRANSSSIPRSCRFVIGLIKTNACQFGPSSTFDHLEEGIYVPCLKVAAIGRPCCSQVAPSLNYNVPCLSLERLPDVQRSNEVDSWDSRNSIVRSLLISYNGNRVNEGGHRNTK